MTNYDWQSVVFSDEKIWRIRPCTHHVRVWRKRGDRYDARYTVKTTARSVGVMVWVAINSSGEMMWKRCPDTVNALEYQNILSGALSFIRPRYFLLNNLE